MQRIKLFIKNLMMLTLILSISLSSISLSFAKEKVIM